MKSRNLKQTLLLPVLLFSLFIIAFAFTTIRFHEKPKQVVRCCNNPDANHTCIMKTIFGLDTSKDGTDPNSFVPPPLVVAAITKGLDWMEKAQGNDGGWGSGSHYNQGLMDPHAVPSDPATTSLVGMALLRSGITLQKGNYAANLKKATEFLLKAVEQCSDDQQYLTTLTNTQPQIKLGRNIDVILTAQFFTNLLRYELNDAPLKKRVEKNLDKCIGRIQKGQDVDGGWKDGGWAPVLQSALANNALESAQEVGRDVDSTVMTRSHEYQNGNFDVNTKSAVTGKSAGVVLYSLSGTTRASAKHARKADDFLTKAKKDGKLKKEDKVTEENLRIAGASAPEARELYTAYQVNQASRNEAMRSDVMEGFGSNGGEEFLSYLMTGESMVMQAGNEWKTWYDMMTGKLVKIQNNDGSWNGHHCITSPVFCTGTCLLILSIHNDMEFSIQPGQNKKGF